jgi:transcriptional regulator with XRE-family HTH domain/DNA-binding transcriptional ArsR family regulator
MNKTISEKIFELRKSRDLTQEQLGEKLGISGQAVSKWEKGESLPDILILPVLCQILGISIDTLLEMPAEAEKANSLKSFTNYATKAGTSKALFEAFDATSSKTAPDGSPCVGIHLSLCSDFMKLYDPRGMGYVFSGNDYFKYLMSYNPDEAAAFFTTLSNKNVLCVLKELDIDKPYTKEELAEKLQLSPDEISAVLLILMEKDIVNCDYNDDNKYGYMLSIGSFMLLLPLTGFFLSTMDGRKKNVKGIGLWFSRKPAENN